MKRVRYAMHSVPVYAASRADVTGMRWFGTSTAATKFAKDQCKEHGHPGFTVFSYSREQVEALLTAHVPLTDRFGHASERSAD